jgi:hypothetical protein
MQYKNKLAFLILNKFTLQKLNLLKIRSSEKEKDYLRIKISSILKNENFTC